MIKCLPIHMTSCHAERQMQRRKDGRPDADLLTARLLKCILYNADTAEIGPQCHTAVSKGVHPRIYDDYTEVSEAVRRKIRNRAGINRGSGGNGADGKHETSERKNRRWNH